MTLHPYPQNLSRRSFLKLGVLTLACLAARPLPRLLPPDGKVWDMPPDLGLGRVTVEIIRKYAAPSFSGEKAGWLRKDALIEILEVIQSEAGPPANPRWYRLADGFVHSAHIQHIRTPHFNPIPARLPNDHYLAQVSVPITQSLRYTRQEGWQTLYRLYYQSVHTVTGIDEGPDGQPWYRLTDDLLYVDYHVPAHHLRLLPSEIYAPINAGVSPEEKLIRISIAEQTLRAYAGSTLAHECRVSSGVHTPEGNLAEGELPTDTPLGRFRILTKMPHRHMGDGKLTSDPLAYELPGVPWTMIFHEWGVALHGAYWHDNFGNRMSHGCINLRPADALWLFRWTDPVYTPGAWAEQGRGTWIEIDS